MLKPFSILAIICILIFLAGWVQVYLLLNMGFFGLGDVFFVASLFITLLLLAFSPLKRRKAYWAGGIMCLVVFVCVEISFSHIESYYFNNAQFKGNQVKADLKKYHETHDAFPETLKAMYSGSGIPKYNIGLVKYEFGYYRTDTSYNMSFNLFKARTFCNKGAYDTWVFCD